MKFNKALDEATETITKKETASFTSQKKKEWKNKKNKKTLVLPLYLLKTLE